METAGSPPFAPPGDVDEEVHRGAILLMGFTRPWCLKISPWPDDSSNRWSADGASPACGSGDDDAHPTTSAVMWRTDDFPDWGRQRKRSRTAALPGIREGADVRSRSGKKAMRRASPQSPLEGYSSASASGGEEGTRRPSPATKLSRSSSAGVAASVPPAIVHTNCAVAAAVVFPGDGSQFPTEMEMAESRGLVASSRATPPVPGAPGPIVRPTGKKLKKVELKAQERWLLEERAKIQQELKELGRAVEEVKAERRELELRWNSPKIEAKAAEVLKTDQRPGLCQDIVPGISHMTTISSSKSKPTDYFEIPDLNDPLPVFQD